MAVSFSLKNLTGGFGLFDKGSESVVGIDFGSSAIKLVQLRKKGGHALLETYGELALGPYAGVEIGRATNLPMEKRIEALSDLMREANVTTKSAGLSIPLASTLLSLIQVPTVDEKRMAEMVPIEARRYIPVPISEVTLDWWAIPRSEEIFAAPQGSEDHLQDSTKTDVLLVAILNEALERNKQIVRDLNLTNVFYEIEIFAAVRASLDQGIQPVMVLDMGAASTKLYLVEHGIVKDSHIINRGAQDITLSLASTLNIPIAQAEETKRLVGLSSAPEHKQITETITLVLGHIFAEANRVMQSFEKRSNKPLSKIVLTGGGAVLKGFTESAQIHFKTEIVSATPFDKVTGPAYLNPEVLKTIGPEFAVAAGIALRKLIQVE
jgi:type IV pilus assembly protein PilM